MTVVELRLTPKEFDVADLCLTSSANMMCLVLKRGLAVFGSRYLDAHHDRFLLFVCSCCAAAGRHFDNSFTTVNDVNGQCLTNIMKQRRAFQGC